MRDTQRSVGQTVATDRAVYLQYATVTVMRCNVDRTIVAVGIAYSEESLYKPAQSHRKRASFHCNVGQAVVV